MPNGLDSPPMPQSDKDSMETVSHGGAKRRPCWITLQRVSCDVVLRCLEHVALTGIPEKVCLNGSK